MTNDITTLPAFKTSGEFSITNSLKFGFSLFCRVLLLAFFSYLFLFRVLLFSLKRKSMTSILHKEVFQDPITIIFIRLWPHFEGSQ